MKRNNYLMIAVFAIIAVVYNFVVFSVIKEHTASFWSAYGFTMFAMAAAAVTYILAFSENKNATFLNVPITFVATVYFSIQLILGIILMMISNLSVISANVFQIIVLALFSVVAIGGLIGKNVVVDVEREVKEKKYYIKFLAADVEGLIAAVSGAVDKKALTDLFETIRYSDPMSDPSLHDLEQNIATKVSALAGIVNRGNAGSIIESCSEIKQFLEDRNRKCKLLK